MERRWSLCQRTQISQNEKHEHEYQDNIERMTLNLFQLQLQLAAFIINLEGVHQNQGTLPFSSSRKSRGAGTFFRKTSPFWEGGSQAHM